MLIFMREKLQGIRLIKVLLFLLVVFFEPMEKYTEVALVAFQST